MIKYHPDDQGVLNTGNDAYITTAFTTGLHVYITKYFVNFFRLPTTHDNLAIAEIVWGIPSIVSAFPICTLRFVSKNDRRAFLR